MAAHSTRTLIPLVGALAALLAGSVQAELDIENFWVRAMPPTQAMTAAYGRLVNTGSTEVSIGAIRTDIATAAELHHTVRRGDRVTMEAMGSVRLAPGEQLTLKPGGAHLMLTGIETMPQPGTDVTLCVEADGQSHCIQAPVLRQAPDGAHDDHDHSQHH